LKAQALSFNEFRETYKQKSKHFIVEWISRGRCPDDVFKITPEFYDYVINNNITSITKQMYEEYLAT
jgi:hypothetical protein